MKEKKNRIKKDLFNGVICKEGNRQTAGITLIALVFTIILLLILAGVTLNILLGENGIINRTKTAKDENEKATATETMNLKITNVQMSKYAEQQRMPTLKELADNFCEDDDFQYVQETSKVSSLTKITNNNPTSIYTKLKTYPYEFEINSSLQLASIDGVKIANTSTNDDEIKNLKSQISNLNTQLDHFKTTIATAITSKGIKTNSTDSAETMATNISNLSNDNIICPYVWGSGNECCAYFEFSKIRNKKIYIKCSSTTDMNKGSNSGDGNYWHNLTQISGYNEIDVENLINTYSIDTSTYPYLVFDSFNYNGFEIFAK